MYISLLLVVTIYCFFFLVVKWDECKRHVFVVVFNVTWWSDPFYLNSFKVKFNSLSWNNLQGRDIVFVWEYNTSFIILGPFCCSFMLLHSIQFFFSSFLGWEDYPKNNINFVLKPTLIDGSPNNKIMQLVKTIVVEVTWQLIVL